MSDVILKIENTYSQLLLDNQVVKDVLWKALRFKERNYYHNPRYRLRLWDGFTNFFKIETGRFLTGLLPEVKLALKQMGVEYKIIDKRHPFEFTQESVDEQWLNKHLRKGVKPVELRDYQVDYINQSIRNLRGTIFAPTSCHAKGQGVLMFDGTIKKVEDVQVGDLVMGDDGRKRTVVELFNGVDDIYRIIPKRRSMESGFTVTANHVLTLESTGVHRYKQGRHRVNLGGKRRDISVKDYLKLSKNQKHIWKSIKTGANFSTKELPLDPYLLGVLIGDGSYTSTPGVTTQDKIMVDYLETVAIEMNLSLNKMDSNGTRCPTYYFTAKKRSHNNNFLREKLKQLKIWGQSCGDKRIPIEYLTSDVQQRLSLLAGLIDTDGSISRNNSYDFVTKSPGLAQDVVFLARSLGFHSSYNKCSKKCQTGAVGEYYRIYMSGLVQLPTKLKKVSSDKMMTKSLRYGFSVKHIGKGNYYGFALKEDPHYLLDDFTITHNSGKTNTLIGILLAVPEDAPSLVLANRKSLVDQNYDEISIWMPGKVGKFYGGKKEIKQITCATVQSAHLLKDYFPKVRCLFVDEIHEMMSRKPRAVYNACKNASVRIAMSATPFKFGEKDKVQKYEVKGYIGPVFKAQNTETGRLSVKDLQERGILSSAECVFYPVHEPKLPYHTYIDAVTDGIAHNMVLHEMTRRLVESLDGRILIIVERIAHGDLLHDIIPNSLWVRGQDTLETRKEIIRQLKENTTKTVGIATSGIFNTGLNVFLNFLINCGGGQAEHQIIQRFGRGLRVADDKKHLKYYDWYFTNNDYLEKHSEARMRILEKEGHPILLKEKFDL